MPTNAQQLESPWPHRLAVALCCATFPLIWIGGLVTTYDAGMAVPDWPNTYGYNLFLYPWTTWILGPWDLFIEHGHRLLAATVGLLTIVFLAVTWRCDQRRWMRMLAVAALALVIAQGVLGGLRVVLDARTLAMLHGCTGPLFFGLSVAMAIFTSRSWRTVNPAGECSIELRLVSTALAITMLAYLQVLLGAQLRHVLPEAPPSTFRVFVVFHVIVAIVLSVGIVWLAAQAIGRRLDGWLARPAIALLGLIGLQLALGAATWVTNYGWPSWFADHYGAAHFVVVSKGFWQANLTTAHVAVGSLIPVTSLLASLRMLRLAHFGSRRARLTPAAWGAAA